MFYKREEDNMPRTQERTTLLSRDTSSAVRYFCFGNLSEFYRRYRGELSMSRATFFRVLQGEYATEENVNLVELLAVRLKITDKKGGSSYLIKSQLTSQFVDIADKVLRKASIQALDELREFLKENRGVFLA